MAQDLLREAAEALRARAARVAVVGSRWMVDLSDDGLAVCTDPPDEYSSVIVALSYLGNPDHGAPAHAMDAAAHIAAFDPTAAAALADWLDYLGQIQDRAGDIEGADRFLAPAHAFARAYLHQDQPQTPA